MTSTKLPAYFEKYLDKKFEEVAGHISELKTHVNDEIQILREAVQSLEKKIYRLYVITACIGGILVIHDIYGGDILNLVKSLFL